MTAKPRGHRYKESQQCHTYMEPMNATSNQKAKPWTSPECSMWNLNGISILQGKGHGLAVEAQPNRRVGGVAGGQQLATSDQGVDST